MRTNGTLAPETVTLGDTLAADRAQAYVDWLSEQTGRNYRLPTAAELAALKAARTGAGLSSTT
ncbi:SUMF1/EgtB/PvdO family nonheme iron enzyme [Salinibacter ruber]|uniref:SUMF1/EgtB/PvdO family nonheme iron enzyme n=1 Tax=Salinibacter ruber TaxID=146919 RepID=UPI0019676ECF|nr:SUMF1/EgtB/PvdO family nonheme iron enzyme [Salinibacter ruber]